jgi:hypothetical protein
MNHQVTLRYDNNTENIIQELKEYWGLKDEADVFAKSLTQLRVATAIHSTEGELIARRGSQETKILLR